MLTPRILALPVGTKATMIGVMASATGESRHFDVVVIGGGHAGAEAAWAAARMGVRTAMVTMQADAIGRMSCNPAIGGLGKGQMVREVDALGGLMGLAIDAAGIQFRMLNRSKGPAVWAPRAQADRDAYAAAVQRLLRDLSGLDIIEGTVEQIVTTRAAQTPDSGAKQRVTGVVLGDGSRLTCAAVVVTTGTFMRALMHCGRTQTEGGRVGEPSARGISACLSDLGFELARLKTGTPPRVHRDSLDYGRLEPQPGDAVPTPFSFLTEQIAQPQVNCWITYTNERTHALIRANLHQAPMYSGQIQSRGPRYCPSIEDKVVRFADKDRHQLFLEPEGYESERVYCNGISTSLPADVQAELVRTVPGLEDARVLQAGYAVEYDFVPTHQTRASLESKLVSGLFLAGQINGTSGYEEAAAQGLMAGINAARAVAGQTPVVLRRDQAYIGVMLDDLITAPPTEPYRMFTSRAEYRLHLRSDNADQRLTPIGRDLGLVDDVRWAKFRSKLEQIETLRALTARTSYQHRPLTDYLARPEASLDTLAAALGIHLAEPASRPGSDGHAIRTALEQVLIDARYKGYVARQKLQIERLQRLEAMPIPAGVNYAGMTDLRFEAREKFASIGPATLGQAGRISGITPADITVLWVYLTGRRVAS